jgi:SnoaL-like protein
MMLAVNHVTIVRRAFEGFNQKDFDRVLDDFDPGVELSDTLRPGAIVRGRAAVRELWLARFSQATAHFVIDQLLEVDSAVLASVRFQPYTEQGASFGHEVSAMYRFTFDGDHVVRLEARTLDEVPESVRSLFGVT